MAGSTPPALPVLSFGSIAPPTASQLPGFPTVVLDNPADQLGPVASASASRTGLETTKSSFNNLPDLKHLARTVLNAKRVAVVCGAGISTASGIPDFRSSSGLFESLKHKYPDAKLSSGRDLFDVGLFSSEHSAAIYYNMIAELRRQTDESEPTRFHRWLKQLDDDGKLFRVYTQNIDALEERAGLTYGLGPTSTRPSSPAATLSPPPPPLDLPISSQASTTSTVASDLSLRRYDSSSSLSSLSSCSERDDDDGEETATKLESSASIRVSRPLASDAARLAPSPARPTTANTATAVPRCIPLHGHLSTLSCALCSTTYPLADHLALLAAGQAPLCPSCVSISHERQVQNRRSLGVGYLKPDVVLYGEHHKDGARIGEITSRDLGRGKRPDLLIVVGTSLKVPGTKKLVKELSKVIKPPPPPPAARKCGDNDDDGSSTRVNPRSRKKDKISTVFLNQEFPGGGKEWMGVFDCWVRGDIQEFVDVVDRERVLVEQEERVREDKRNQRKDRDAAAANTKTIAGGGAGRGKKLKDSKLPARPPPPPQPRTIAATTLTRDGGENGRKRASPPSPTRSPTKEKHDFYIEVPLLERRPSASPTLPIESGPSLSPTKKKDEGTIRNVKKRSRRSSPVLSLPPPPSQPSKPIVGTSQPTTATLTTRRSARVSLSSSSSSSDAATVGGVARRGDALEPIAKVANENSRQQRGLFGFGATTTKQSLLASSASRGVKSATVTAATRTTIVAPTKADTTSATRRSTRLTSRG